LPTSSRFHEAVARVEQLRAIDCYQAAFIFGLARGEEEEGSDLDVRCWSIAWTPAAPSTIPSSAA
jgi:hypothetical protein